MAINNPAKSGIVSPIKCAINGGDGAAAGVAILADTLAYWDISEASGTRNDSHTNGYHLTDVNTVGSRTGLGGSGTAADFVAANLERLEHGNAVWDFQGTDWALAFWLNPDILSGNPGFCSLDGAVEQIRIDWTVSTFRMIAFKASGNQSVSVAMASTGTDYFCQAYYNAATKEIGVAIDDGAFSTDTLTAHPRSSGASPKIQFGRWGGSGNYYDGALQYAGAFTSPLTAAQWTELYNSGSGRAYSELT